jgi:hypothetical protein
MAAADIFGQAVARGNSVINVTIGGVEYIAEAPPGTKTTDAAWRCTAVYPLDNGGRFVKQAAGFHAPGADGALLPTLTYLPEE